MTPNPSSSDHDELKGLLASSFHSEPSDDVPPLPEDLRERIRDQYGRQSSSAGSEAPGESLLDRLLSLVRRPAFAGAAAAVLLLLVALVVFLPKGDPAGDGMRGTASGAAKTVTIMLLDVPAEVKDTLLKRGFDEQAIRTVTDPSAATSSEGPAILVDGREAELEYHPGGGGPAVISELPDTPGAIATEVLKLAAPPKDE